jgi:hypothetical protein
VVPHPAKAGQEVLELRELHLHARLLGSRTGSEDVEDKLRAVHDADTQQVFEALSLGRAQLFVEDDEVALSLGDELAQLARLALTDIEARARAIDALNERPNDLTPRRIGQATELLEVLVDEMPGSVTIRRADQDGPLDRGL